MILKLFMKHLYVWDQVEAWAFWANHSPNVLKLF